jgi:phosphatidylinositol alpha-1,6-mannosyltransferase
VSRSLTQFSVPLRRSSPGQPTRIVGLFPELLTVGGVQEAGRQTALALDGIAQKRGWSLSILSLNDNPPSQAVRVGNREIPLTGFGRAKAAFAWSAFGAARSETRLVVAVHPHLALPAQLMKIRAQNLRVVVMSHGIEVWSPLPKLRRSALQFADCVVAPSTETERKLAEVQGVAQKKIRRLPWPVNAQILELSSVPETLEAPPSYPNGRVVLTVGRWASAERYKGADDLIEAVAQLRASLPDLYLVAVGGGDDLSRLRQLASDRGVADRVVFLERLSRERIAACYARCDVFALPSTGEGFGIVFLEAMAFGKPVMGANAGGVPDLIENGVNGLLVPPKDKQKLVQVLGELLADPAKCMRLGRKGAEIVRSRYTFDSFKCALGEILDSTLAATPTES